MIINQYALARSHALYWLNELKSEPVAFTAYVKTDAAEAEVDKLLSPALDRGAFRDELCKRSAGSPAGAVIFYKMGEANIVLPPFPLAESSLQREYGPGPLLAMLEHDWNIGLVLVRLGHYAIGLFHGETLVDGKAGTGLVHARHHKGGSSAQRFERHRAKQMEYFFSRIEAHAREILEPGIKRIDYVFYGGTRDTLLRMWRQCHFFSLLEERKVERLLNVREPRRSSFSEAIKEVYSCRVFNLRE